MAERVPHLQHSHFDPQPHEAFLAVMHWHCLAQQQALAAAQGHCLAQAQAAWAQQQALAALAFGFVQGQSGGAAHGQLL
jgi:hypothetical protein